MTEKRIGALKTTGDRIKKGTVRQMGQRKSDTEETDKRTRRNRIRGDEAGK